MGRKGLRMMAAVEDDRSSSRAGMHRVKCGGFTLVELIVALLIASLVVTLALPALSGVVARAELKSTVGQLAAALRKARGQAILRRKETSLLVEIDERRFGIAGDKKTHVFDEDLEVKLLTADLDPSRPDISEVRFFPDGTSSGGKITVAHGAKSYVVRVDWLTGRVTVRDNDHARDNG